jgi:hypothetical protein
LEIFALWRKRKILENSITSHNIRAPPPLLPAKPAFPKLTRPRPARRSLSALL